MAQITHCLLFAVIVLIAPLAGSLKVHGAILTPMISSFVGDIVVTVQPSVDTLERKANVLEYESLKFVAHEPTSVSEASIVYSKRQATAHLNCSGCNDVYSGIPFVDLVVHTLCAHNKVAIGEKIEMTFPLSKEFRDNFIHSISGDEESGSVYDTDRTILPEYSEKVDWVGVNGEVLCPLPRSIIHKYNLLHGGMGVLLVTPDHKSIYVHQRSADKRIFPSKYDMFVGGVSQAGESAGLTLLRELKEECDLDLTLPEPIFASPAASKTTPPPPPILTTTTGATGATGTTGTSSVHIDTGNSFSTAADGKDLSWKQMAERTLQRYKLSLSILGTTEREEAPLATSAEVAPVPVGTSIRYIGRTTVRTSYNHCIVDCFCVTLSNYRQQRIHFQDGEIQWGQWMTVAELEERLQNGGRDDFVPDGMQVWDALPAMNFQFLK